MALVPAGARGLPPTCTWPGSSRPIYCWADWRDMASGTRCRCRTLMLKTTTTAPWSITPWPKSWAAKWLLWAAPPVAPCLAAGSRLSGGGGPGTALTQHSHQGPHGHTPEPSLGLPAGPTGYRQRGHEFATSGRLVSALLVSPLQSACRSRDATTPGHRHAPQSLCPRKATPTAVVLLP